LLPTGKMKKIRKRGSKKPNGNEMEIKKPEKHHQGPTGFKISTINDNKQYKYFIEFTA
jgi:hypothetical protein